MGLIYQAKNKINGKSYIGLTVKTLSERKRTHLARVNFGSKYHFHNAIRKYGFETFEWIILETGITDKIKLDKLEIQYIKKFDSIKNGYNISTGGGGGDTLTNHPNRKNICQKISDKQKGKKMKASVKKQWYKKMYIDCPDRFKKENNPMYGKKLSKETKEKISKSGKENHNAKGYHHTRKTKKKISESLKGTKKSEEFKKMVSKVHKGKILSKETKMKISESKKGKISWSKLNETQVKEIKHLLKNKNINHTWKYFYQILANKFNVSSRCIQKIRHNITWKNIHSKYLKVYV